MGGGGGWGEEGRVPPLFRTGWGGGQRRKSTHSLFDFISSHYRYFWSKPRLAPGAPPRHPAGRLASPPRFPTAVFAASCSASLPAAVSRCQRQLHVSLKYAPLPFPPPPPPPPPRSPHPPNFSTQIDAIGYTQARHIGRVLMILSVKYVQYYNELRRRRICRHIYILM